ncbi:MAG: adenylyl-sulfate kinase [Opitutaceae bacterium]|nr:adenylyl-sulfate kinase [Opitutaceae bacterium]
MSTPSDNLFPTDHLLRSRAEREVLLRQRAVVVWLCGLSGSGKTTLANALDRRLAAAGFASAVLDGDNVRNGLNRGLGFSDDDRRENIRRVAEVSRLFVQSGLIVINSFITPRHELRDLAREIIGAGDLLEVHVEASFETCARRDPKGLYAKAGAGGVASFTGRDSAFEPPTRSDLVLHTERESPTESLERLWALVHPRVVRA